MREMGSRITTDVREMGSTCKSEPELKLPCRRDGVSYNSGEARMDRKLFETQERDGNKVSTSMLTSSTLDHQEVTKSDLIPTLALVSTTVSSKLKA